ncbi:CorA family divalent cation transporter [Sulfurimonas sp.]|jgi:magnesium transporter|uniref:magnesium transporter CorA family protein n=1 Tax=Sulfurimonas sp. TaxID=2022749 RepID=UPI0025D41509|nr:CorA family divalent cation transporter [Sulfurimonas sp.]MCK9473027.1 magnesium transporter [Sulfurimonas sp.]MDD3505356.1 CorA family divalent cation transporter [Sulfurimonas sp.]
MKNIHELVDSLHLDDLQNEAHPSIFDENEGYEMLILRLPVILDKLEIVSTGFIITPHVSYLYNRDEKKFKPLQSRFESPYKMLDGIVDELLKSFEKYRDLIADMEEALYLNKKTQSFMNQWLKFKRNIIKIERVLLHASSTMERVIAYYENSDDFPLNHYIDLHEHIERTRRSATLQLSKLDYIFSFYNTRTNERMNALIYNLTIISAIFLPLNLVVGFFGMNTSGLPFTQGASGTTNVMILTLCLFFVAVGVIGFIKRRF